MELKLFYRGKVGKEALQSDGKYPASLKRKYVYGSHRRILSF